MATFIPNQVDAFWPFSTNASAAGTGSTIPSSETPVLKSNSNSSAPIALVTSGDSALVSYSGVNGTPADIASSIPPGRISVHEVGNGETLSDIAGMFNVSINTIIWANNLSSAKDIHAGDILIILPVSGISHTVIKGDTLKSLALKYYEGTDVTTLAQSIDEIAQYNGLDPKVPLKVGSIVIIPGGKITASAPVKLPTSTLTTNSPSRVGGSFLTGYFSSPLPSGIITQGLHDGNAVDIGSARGTPIHAAADGTVIIVRSNGGWNGGYGNYVVILHPNGTQTLYAHMQSAIVSFEQSVSSGQIIGYVGMTGRTTGPHVHFEVRGAANPLANCTLRSVCSPQ